VYHLKHSPTITTYCGTKINSEAGPPDVIDSPNLPCDTQIKITLVARLLLMPVVRKLFRCKYGVLTSRMYVYSETLLSIEIICCCS
jgi:hypothetical protein